MANAKPSNPAKNEKKSAKKRGAGEPDTEVVKTDETPAPEPEETVKTDEKETPEPEAPPAVTEEGSLVVHTDKVGEHGETVRKTYK